MILICPLCVFTGCHFVLFSTAISSLFEVFVCFHNTPAALQNTHCDSCTFARVLMPFFAGYKHVFYYLFNHSFQRQVVAKENVEVVKQEIAFLVSSEYMAYKLHIHVLNPIVCTYMTAGRVGISCAVLYRK